MRKFILGSDWWTDCDDVVATRLLCNCHLQKKIDFLGMCLDACMEKSVASCAGFLHWHGVDIPVGLDGEATHFLGTPPYQHYLATLPSAYRSNADAEPAVHFYRRLLAANEEVELLEIGFPQVLAALLASTADELSPLSGEELVRQKVKRLWIMAGKWDEQGGREHNFCLTREASEAASNICSSWPTPITFLGWEVGYTVITGNLLDADDPLKKAMIEHGSPNGRMSWDPMLALLAVIGDCGKAGYSTVRGTASVKPEDGANFFEANPNGSHEYVVKKEPDSFYADQINALIVPLGR